VLHGLLASLLYDAANTVLFGSCTNCIAGLPSAVDVSDVCIAHAAVANVLVVLVSACCCCLGPC
jgi:hypothetical protein